MERWQLKVTLLFTGHQRIIGGRQHGVDVAGFVHLQIASDRRLQMAAFELARLPRRGVSCRKLRD